MYSGLSCEDKHGCGLFISLETEAPASQADLPLKQ